MTSASHVVIVVRDRELHASRIGLHAVPEFTCRQPGEPHSRVSRGEGRGASRQQIVAINGTADASRRRPKASTKGDARKVIDEMRR
jgi:hypothetical protein